MKEEKSYAKNYTDRLIIEKTEEKYFDGKQNEKYEIDFENSIFTKSCVNLCIKSINDPNIYSKEYRHFARIKLLLIKSKYKSKEENSEYITNILDNGMYKVIPYSNYYYKIKFHKCEFYISYSGNQLILQDYYYNYIDKLLYIKHKKALLKSITSSTDTYIGTYQLFNEGKKYLELIIFSS